MKELKLPIKPRHSYEKELFETESSQEALQALDRWCTESMPLQIAFIGPCHKSALANIAAQKKGITVNCSKLPEDPTGPVIIDDADQIIQSESFFHWYNNVMANKLPVLYTAAKAPVAWPHTLPDLVSRLSTIPIVRIQPWTDDELKALIPHIMRLHGFIISESNVNFILHQMERSLHIVTSLVDFLHVHAPHKRVTRKLIKSFLSSP